MFLIYYNITIYICVPHFYDLSALVGCWSSVSIGRIIKNNFNFKFLNRRVHRFILYPNYMMFLLVFLPPLSFEIGFVLFAVAEGWLLLDIR